MGRIAPFPGARSFRVSIPQVAITCNLDSNSAAVMKLGANDMSTGTDARLFASTDYEKTQAWGRAFMEHLQNFDGILYHSRKNPRLKLCFFRDRVCSSSNQNRRYSSVDRYERFVPGLGTLRDQTLVISLVGRFRCNSHVVWYNVTLWYEF